MYSWDSGIPGWLEIIQPIKKLSGVKSRGTYCASAARQLCKQGVCQTMEMKEWHHIKTPIALPQISDCQGVVC